MITINEYFNGTVKSLAYAIDGQKSSVGVLEAGEFEFGTSSHEIMNVIEGSMSVLLPESSEWQNYAKGQSFEVPAGSSFKVSTSAQASYLCQYR